MTGGESVRLSTDETGLRLSVELQLTYATGVVAGTVMAAYQILAYGRDTGFDSFWKLATASFLATLLEIVRLPSDFTNTPFWKPRPADSPALEAPVQARRGDPHQVDRRPPDSVPVKRAIPPAASTIR